MTSSHLADAVDGSAQERRGAVATGDGACRAWPKGGIGFGQLDSPPLPDSAMSHVLQQVLALDARYNAHRAPGNPSLRALYLR